MTIPRPEYPRPQFVRSDWMNLNGQWDFEIDRGDSGLERGLVNAPLSGTITVPFAPESTASGVGDVDYLIAVWYTRMLTIPEEWAGRRILLHFGAVDQDATVWVEGHEVARHRGGFTPFSCDITDYLVAGTPARITVRARDPKDGPQARGKQSVIFENANCDYTRTTGIWQTVWVEPVSAQHMRRPRIVPDLDNGRFAVTIPLSRNVPGSRVVARVLADGELLDTCESRADTTMAPTVQLTVPASAVRAWTPSDPYLYTLTFELVNADGEVIDHLDSYSGLRSVAIDGNRILINGQPIFQRLVLDQGYWSETIMTAPSEEAIIADIELGMELGFNGARLHQKVFEERYLYHCDRLGYLVWGEFGDWGGNVGGPSGFNQRQTTSYTREWVEAVERDLSHPAIVGWCPLNETWERRHDRQTQLDDVMHAMYEATKLADPTRPVLDSSGYSHRVVGADVYDSHCYTQDPAKFAEQMSGLATGQPYTNTDPDGNEMSIPYAGQPYFVSEFGGIWWNEALAGTKQDAHSWGYGQRVADIDEFYSRFAGQIDALLDDVNMFGYCYTQLTDVFQEQNGLVDFDRQHKFDPARIRAIQQRQAAFERTAVSTDPAED